MKWTPSKLAIGGYVLLADAEVFGYAIHKTGLAEADEKLLAEVLAALLSEHLDQDDVDSATIIHLKKWMSDKANYYLVEQNTPAKLAGLYMSACEQEEESLERERILAYERGGEREGCYWCGADTHRTQACVQDWRAVA